MKQFAVGYTNLNDFDNELIIEIIEAEDWKNALGKHSAFKTPNPDFNDWNTLSDLKREFVDIDILIDVVEIPTMKKED